MKTSSLLVLGVILGMAVTHVWGASGHISVTGSYRSFPEKIVTGKSAYTYSTNSAGVYTLRAVLPMPRGVTLDSKPTVKFNIGDAIIFSTSEMEPVSGSLAARTFTYKGYEYDFKTDEVVHVSTLTYSWDSDSATITAHYTPILEKDPLKISEMAAFTDFPGDINATVRFTNDSIPCYFSVEKNDVVVAEYVRYLAVEGTDSRTYNTVKDSAGELSTYELHTVNVSGTADMIPPAVYVQTPVRDIVVNELKPITLAGTARDVSAIASIFGFVVYPDGKVSEHVTAEVTQKGDSTAWTIKGLVPQAGTNIFHVTVVDGAGNSNTIIRLVTFQQWTELSVVTNGMGSISIAGLRNGKAAVGSSYRVTLTPARGYVLADWGYYSGVSTSGDENSYAVGWNVNPTITVDSTNAPVFKATFIPTPYGNLKGSYTGLANEDYAYVTNANMLGEYEYSANSTNLGLWTITITSNGICSGKWVRRSDTMRFTLAGYMPTYYSLDGVEGLITNDWQRYTNNVYFISETSHPKFTLMMNLTNRSRWTGYYYDLYETGESRAPHMGYVQGYRDRSSATNADAGTYNIGFMDNDGSESDSVHSTARMGYSFATAVVGLSGSVSMRFQPADGSSPATVMTTSQAEDGRFQFFSPMYTGLGHIRGWLALTNGVITCEAMPTHMYDDANVAKVLWIKPGMKKGAYYSEGFTNWLSVSGERYESSKSTNILDWTKGTLSLTSYEGDLVASAGVKYSNYKLNVQTNDNKISLTLSPKTGAIAGSFMYEKRRIPFTGLVIGKDAAVGYFNDKKGGTGSVKLEGVTTMILSH